MKFLISAVVSMSLLSANSAFALGKREEGVLIGLGSAILVGSVLKDRRSGGSYGEYGDYRYNDRAEFPPFRCNANSVQCAYERGVWEREYEIWKREKDRAYRCGRYGECGEVQ